MQQKLFSRVFYVQGAFLTAVDLSTNFRVAFFTGSTQCWAKLIPQYGKTSYLAVGSVHFHFLGGILPSTLKTFGAEIVKKMPVGFLNLEFLIQTPCHMNPPPSGFVISNCTG